MGCPPLHALLPPTHRGRNLSMEPLDFRDDGGGKCRRLNSDAHTEGTCRLPKAARRQIVFYFTESVFYFRGSQRCLVSAPSGEQEHRVLRKFSPSVTT